MLYRIVSVTSRVVDPREILGRRAMSEWTRLARTGCGSVLVLVSSAVLPSQRAAVVAAAVDDLRRLAVANDVGAAVSVQRTAMRR